MRGKLEINRKFTQRICLFNFSRNGSVPIGLRRLLRAPLITLFINLNGKVK